VSAKVVEGGEPVSVELPSLAKKLNLLYAYSELRQRSLAKRLGVRESTVSGWANGTKHTAAGQVSLDGADKLSDLLVEVLGGTIDEAMARGLWLGPETAFVRAFYPSPSQRFLNLLAAAERQKMVTYLTGADAGIRLVRFVDPAKLPRDAIRAAVGESFALSLVAQPRRQIVLLVESAIGCHLGVPGPGAPPRLDAAGNARLPSYPDLYSFDEPKGLHRFLTFAIDAAEPLSIATCAGREIPLGETELDVFAAELSNNRRVRSWVLDILLVGVR
jgi:transcriptional regulator with XRE-family HTH domain